MKDREWLDMKNTRFLLCIAGGFSACLVVCFLWACGSGSDTNGAGAGLGESGAASASGGAGEEEKSGSAPAGPNGATVKIRLLDDVSGKPVAGAKVKLFYTPIRSTEKVLCLGRITTLDGEVVFEPGPTARMMVRSEFDAENMEITPAPSGETVVTLKVHTSYEVSGRVLGPGGEAVEGASVFVARSVSGQGAGVGFGLPLPGAGSDLKEFRRRFGYDLEADVLTGEDGGFSAEVKTCQTLLVAVWADRFVCGEWRLVFFQNTKKAYEPLEITLFPAAFLRMTLLSARNESLGGKLVTVIEKPVSYTARQAAVRIHMPYRASLTTGPDGTVEAPVPAGLALGVEGRVVFAKPAQGAALPDAIHDSPMDAFELSPGEKLDIVCMSPRTVRLSGTIRDVRDKPLAGAEVVLPVNRLKTGENGSFSIVIPYNNCNRMWYTVSKPGYRTERGLIPEIEKGSRELHLDAVLKPGLGLTVDVERDVEAVWLLEEPRGEGASVNRVKCKTSGCELLPDTGALTKAERIGEESFLINGVKPGSYTVLVQKGGHCFGVREGVQVNASLAEAGPLDLTGMSAADAAFSGGAAALEGVVRIPEGVNPHRIVVTMLRNDLPGVRGWDPLSRGKGRMGMATVIAGPEGGFRIEGLAPSCRYAVSGYPGMGQQSGCLR